MNQRAVMTTAIVTALFAAPACNRAGNTEPLTLGEATQALEEAAVSSQAANVMSGTIELTTDFTIGAGLETAADEIRNYVQSQLPCASVTLEGNTLEVEYGAKPGNCTYRGHTYSGSHQVSVTANDEGQVIVAHAWDELSNGVVSVSGDATVTWDGVEVTRHVDHELAWTRLSDGKTGVGRGNRTQRPLSGGLIEGFQVDGTRDWSGDSGEWALDIDGVQVRWADPVPQAGSYTLTTPNDKEIVLSFERIDDDTIKVTLEGTKNTFSLNVNSGA